MPRVLCGAGDRNLPNQGVREVQLSVRTGFDVIINEAQEQSFCVAVGLNLTDALFSHVQLCVGLSVVTHRDRLKDCHPPDSDSRTKNVVYPEA